MAMPATLTAKASAMCTTRNTKRDGLRNGRATGRWNRSHFLGGSHANAWARANARIVPKRRGTCMGLFGLGLPEVAVIAGVAALIFGPSKLPELGKELGKTAKSFKDAAKEFETELKSEMQTDSKEEDEGKTSSSDSEENKS